MLVEDKQKNKTKIFEKKSKSSNVQSKDEYLKKISPHIFLDIKNNTGWFTKCLSCESSCNGKTIKAVIIKIIHKVHIYVNGIVLKGQVSKFRTLSVIKFLL